MQPSTGKAELIALIRHRIQSHGPQPFSWFMEQALYHPQHGYYSSGRARVGRRGDYFTNVSVGPLFGQFIAAQFAEMWERLGKIDNFIIVEQGAHDGLFARDVLGALRETAPKFFSALRYRIIEPFQVWQDRQSQTLEAFRDKVTWNNPEPFVGVHFSNELLDAMPIDLRGKSVGLDCDQFVFVERATESKPKSPTFAWIDNLAAKLQRGFVLAIDYGFAHAEFREVVQARAQHRHLDSPFEQIGEADITAHVNWTDIAERAERNGLGVAGFTDQHHFLTGIISECPRLNSSRSLDLTGLTGQVGASLDNKSKRALQTLLHPEMLGRAFQVVALYKDVDLTIPLAGFKFARDSRAALGL